MGGVVSGITKTLFGGGDNEQKSRSKSEAKDLTPGAFRDLRSPVSQQLQQIFASGGGPQPPQGQLAAPITGNEQQLLGQIQSNLLGGGVADEQQQNLLRELISGQQVGQGPAFQNQGIDIQGIQGGVQQGQENPFLQQAIAAAQRPLIQEFENIVAPALRAQFTQAGQQIQGTGSSPFNEAAAQAQTGLANALGDISGRLAFQDFAQRQALQSDEFQQLRGLMTEQEAIQKRLQSEEFQRDRQRQLDAVSQAQGVDRAQLENLIAGLEAQALPRLVEQFGIDRGLEEFRRRQGQLLQAIQSAGALASPTPVVLSSSTSSGTSTTSPGLLGGLGAFMSNIRSG